MITVRGNCKEGKGQTETLGAETENSTEPDLPLQRLSTFHIRSTVSKFIGKMSYKHGHFREKAGADMGDITFIRKSGTLHFVWGPNMMLNKLAVTAKTGEEKASLCGAGGRAASQGTRFAVIPWALLYLLHH